MNKKKTTFVTNLTLLIKTEGGKMYSMHYFQTFSIFLTHYFWRSHYIQTLFICSWLKCSCLILHDETKMMSSSRAVQLPTDWDHLKVAHFLTLGLVDGRNTSCVISEGLLIASTNNIQWHMEKKKKHQYSLINEAQQTLLIFLEPVFCQTIV